MFGFSKIPPCTCQILYFVISFADSFKLRNHPLPTSCFLYFVAQGISLSFLKYSGQYFCFIMPKSVRKMKIPINFPEKCFWEKSLYKKANQLFHFSAKCFFLAFLWKAFFAIFLSFFHKKEAR